MRLGILIFCFVFSVKALWAQQFTVKFDHLNSSDGLSQNSIYHITQDSLGYIWFATYDGLNRYDGYNLQVFRNNPDDPNSLSDNAVNQIFETQGNRMWIVTKTAGLCRYNYETEKFERFPFPDGITDFEIKKIAQESPHKLWLATEKGLWIFENNKYARISDFNHDEINDLVLSASKKGLWLATNNGLKYFDIQMLESKNIRTPQYEKLGMHQNIKTLFKSIDGTIWLAKQDGVFKINTDRNMHKITCANYNGFFDVNAITEDQKGDIWLATNSSGIVKYETQNQKVTSIDHNPSDPNSLSSNQISSIFIDRNNTLWVGNRWAGVDKWSRTTENVLWFKKNNQPNEGLLSNQIRAIYKDTLDVVWIGTENGGLSRFDFQTQKYKHFNTQNSELPNNIVRAIFEDSKGNFWIGTDGGGLALMDKETGKFEIFQNNPGNPASLSNNRVWTIYETQKGKLLIGTFGGGINVYNYHNQQFERFKHNPLLENSISNDFITSFYQDQHGDVWVGTFGGGLNRWSPTTGYFTHYKQMPGNVKSISNNRVYAINQDTQGQLWIGTKDGLNLYNPKKQEFRRFNQADGLPNNVVMGILASDNNELWISTNKGLARFSTTDFNVKNYDVDDGLQGNEFLVGAHHKAKDGMFFFGGVNGLNAFFPSQIQFNEQPPGLVITEFKLFNQVVEFNRSDILHKPIEFVEQINLKHNQNSFSFDFAALHFSKPHKNRYAYRLVHFNNNWVNVSAARRFVSYTNIDPGEYIFELKASNSDGTWAQTPRRIKIVITPPVWETIWFRILAGITLIALIVLWYRLRVRSIEQKNKKLEEIVQLRTQEIVKQKNEIENQAIELSEKNQELNFQKDEIQKQNELITSSIRYAQTIQSAILPILENTQKYLRSFVIFKPKDIVSGDFYWFGQQLHNQKMYLYYAVVDCTGHGVPGAFMSMIGSRLLNEIVLEKKQTETNTILELLDQGVKKSLKQQQSENNDGMDLCMVRIEYPIENHAVIQFTGAKRPLFYMHQSNIYTAKPDRRSIGGKTKRIEPAPFTAQEIFVQKGNFMVLSTDGYTDQNNPERSRIGTAGFVDLLQQVKNMTPENMQHAFEQKLKSHQAQASQRDDITLWTIFV